MLHLVGNYPDEVLFEECLKTILKIQPEFLEIQLPFNHPVGDGEVIYKANQEAVKFKISLENLVKVCSKIKRQTKSQTKLILMSYLTPVYAFGLKETLKVLEINNFSGLLIPDLPVESQEFEVLLKHKKKDFHLIPVISPNTEKRKLNLIKKKIAPKSLIYATSRKGITGKTTALTNNKIVDYLNKIKNTFKEYEVALGWGINHKTQVEFLNSQGFIAVIGTKIVEIINNIKSSKVNSIEPKLEKEIKSLLVPQT